MKYKTIYKVDGEQVSYAEFVKATEDGSIHKFEVTQEESAQSAVERIKLNAKELKELKKEIEDLKGKIAELEAWQQLHISLYHSIKSNPPSTVPNTTPSVEPFKWPNEYPWYPNVIYCADAKSVSITQPDVKSVVYS